MKKRKITPYPEIRASLNTLDLIVCEHKKLPWRWIGHTACVYRNEVGQLMVFESTRHGGVQLSPMGLWVAEYPGHVGVRRMIYGTEDFTKIFDRFDEVDYFIYKHLGTSYPDLKTAKGLLYLIRAAWDSDIFKKASTNVDNDDWIFCTDLYMRLLKAVGLVGKWVTTSEWEPDDMWKSIEMGEISLTEVSSFSAIDFYLGVVGKASLGEVVWIK